MTAQVLHSERLRLRPFRDEDRADFAAMNADPEVMRHFPAPLHRDESAAAATRIALHFAEHGFGWWVVEVKGGPEFVGVVGLAHTRIEAPFTPAIEIGWRMARAHWGKGYATEAARCALKYGFHTLALAEIVSFTIAANERSWRVMERIGMQRDPAGDFEHPALPEGHALRPHILYRARNPAP